MFECLLCDNVRNESMKNAHEIKFLIHAFFKSAYLGL